MIIEGLGWDFKLIIVLSAKNYLLLLIIHSNKLNIILSKILLSKK